ncbi:MULTISPECIES: ABC transporter permease subunit [unclassified Plantactinospora]|uniref:ABC transporter permease subunit n=1 Tax=unclassified Plantactinospora TaxID=2631981 RepID=UPI000D17C565|nr:MULTISPECIES: ABC transporter permease subunit [unclassified Plantactinospora]AVT30471.1 ABC transporter permease [Plantactinospora sp. BC1]AVT36882.1 ABC transporter permease [Plantactinospora sp. BB1]
MNLVRSELLKIRTTNTWWVFGLITLPLWALTLMINYFQSQALLDPAGVGVPEADAQNAQFQAAGEHVNVAANLYTNGQFFGVLIVMLLGVMVVTNEFFHQTATTTFLTTPHRTAVVVAKLVAAGILGLIFWVVTTGLNLIFTPLILNSLDVSSQLGKGAIWQAIGLNGLAYLLWAVFGIGFGVLIRSQIGATVTALLVYLAGYIGAIIVLSILADRFGDWINNLQLIVPSLASQLMATGTDLPGSPPRWAGAAVMIAYAVVTGTIGTLIMRKRDVS